MNESARHCTPSDLNLLIDGMLSSEERMRVESHIAQCKGCRDSHAAIARLDRTLRIQHLEQPRPDFTRFVMSRVNILPKRVESSSGFRFAVGFAYSFGLLIVLGVMATAFLYFGEIDSGLQNGTEPTAVGSAISAATTSLAGYSTMLGEWITKLAPVGFLKANGGVTLFGGIVVLLLWATDRILLRRILHLK